ncbi:helix-turn-helix domain-containing protein [Lacticaseibacillus kribbianus]|uniref:helix-turn-helix domain-containing protein n=1 Tax=Lacticaseibacillus kribbianus TaxID=2926292 RepID=UPI001CD2DE60|nr:helix-turn-helix domain-containing protein [Lacticaseibacillus kribbianus]
MDQSVDLFLQKGAEEKLSLYRTIQQLKRTEIPAATRVHQQLTGSAPGIDEVNLRRVANLMGRNYGTLYYIYNQLLDQLRALVGDPEADTARLFALSEGAVRMSMIEQSVPYQFLQHVLAEDLPHFEAFVDAVAASRVTCLRYLRPLRDMAKQLGVRIVYEKMHLSGDEANIRIFMTLVYWLATDGAKWPFATPTREAALDQVTTISAAFERDYQSPVIREVLAYYNSVTTLRLAHGHAVAQPVAALSYPVPNLFAAHTELSRVTQFNESQQMYQLNYLLPLFVEASDPAISSTLTTFRHYSPELYHFTDTFLRKLPDTVLDPEKLSSRLMGMIAANLLAVVTSVATFGRDLGASVAYAFNRRIALTSPDAHLETLVRQTVEAVAIQQPLDWLGERDLNALSQALYENLLQVQRFAKPQRKVKVALLLEPVMLGFIDLVSFLQQQPFVELLHDHYEDADLVVQASSLPLTLSGEKRQVTFKWNMNASSDLFGELYGILYTMAQDEIN